MIRADGWLSPARRHEGTKGTKEKPFGFVFFVSSCLRESRRLVVAAGVPLLILQQPAAPQKTTGGLAYERAGAGPAIVFIHGAFLDRRMWSREFDALKSRATVIRYDQRGHGESALPTESFSHVADLLALFDELKIERATLVGLSSGGQIALDAAVAAPARVERLVLAGAAASGFVPKEPPPGTTELVAALKAGEFSKATEVLLATPIYASPPESQPLVRAMLTGNERLWKVSPQLIQKPAVPALSVLEQVKMPTLVLVGDQDIAAIREQAAILGARMPAARVVTIAGGGHLLNLTSSTEFLRLTTDFVTK